MAMTRVTFRGKRLNTRTRDMILAAEKILGYQLRIIQGSYNSGGVAASAGTHDGGGAVDVWGKGTGDAKRVTNVLRQVGFAAWWRTPAQGNWGNHIHAIAIGDPELSRGARNQVTAYWNGRNGLASNGADTFTRAYASRSYSWEDYKAAHPAVVAPPKPTNMDFLGNPIYGKGPFNGRWTRGPVPEHPLYLSVVYLAIGREKGLRKETLDSWEQAHVAKVVQELKHLVEIQGGKPNTTILNLVKQVQTLWGYAKYGDPTYGFFDRKMLDLFTKRQGWTFWDGERSDNGIRY